MADDRFGNIKIDSEFPEGSKGPNVPLTHDKDTPEQSSSPSLEVSSSDSGKKRYRRKKKSKTTLKIPQPSRKVVAWLSVIPLLVILYSVGSYFIIPSIINSLLVPNLSKHFDRPVEVDRVVFSPFNLELFVDNVTVGPVRGDNTDDDLLIMENARFQFSLSRILDGKLVFRQAILDGVSVNVVRSHKDVTVDLRRISDLFLSSSEDQDPSYWPAWLSLDEVKVTAGKIHIDDRQAKKIFTVEDIQFYLPSAATRDRDKAALPQLRAVIDSSPFEINAVRFRNQSGAWRTGFSFEFKKLIINNFKQLLPLPETGLWLSDGEMDINLDIILPGDKHGSEGVVIEGEANLRNVRWQDPETQTVLALPEARIVYHIVPADKLVRLTNVEFHEPELILSGKKATANLEPLASIAYLKSILERVFHADEILEVESFLWNNGKIVMSHGGPAGGRSELNDVTFTLNGFATAGHRRAHPDTDKAAPYTFRAKDISTKTVTEFFSDGLLNIESILIGKLKITGLDLERYPTLLPKSSPGLQKGLADIEFHYEYGGYPVQGQGSGLRRSKVFNGSLKTTGFVLSSDRKKAVSGKMMYCRGFYFDMVSRTVVCNQLEFLKSDIFIDRVFGKKKIKGNVEVDNWQFKINNLLVSGSKIHTSLRGFTTAKNGTLVAHDVSLEGKSLQSENVADNIKASARIGKKGKLTVGGSYSSLTGQGSMQLDIAGMELSLLHPYYSSWFIPKLNKGMLSANGKLQLPAREFKGKIQVDDFDAGEGNGARISWKQAFSNDCTYRHAPLLFKMEELVVQQPSVSPGLSSGDQPVYKYLRRKGETLPPSVQISRIRVEDGSFGLSEPIIYPGYQPLLQNINGTLSPDIGSNQKFSIKGKINGPGTFTLLGTNSLATILSYQLDVQDFSLRPFDSVLKKNAGFSGQKPVISFQQEMVSEDTVSRVGTNIIVRDILPDPASSSALILSLLVNEEHLFEIRVDEQYSDDKPQPFLLEQLINRLRHLEVKSQISPHLVLNSTLPALELPQSVNFVPGSSTLDESVPVAGYQDLLRMRPFISLSLQGQYDPVGDREILQAEQQEEAERQREIENKRRAMEKIKILQQEKRRLKELKAAAPGVITEEIVPSVSNINLQPLPRVNVQIDLSTLEDLARQRALFLQDYLVNQLKFDPARIKLQTGGEKGSSTVRINILPYMPSEGEKKISDS
jgi:hypothetical protein